MALLEIRQRTGWLFVALVVAHLVLISAQAKTDRGVTFFNYWVFGGFAEVQRATNSGVSAVQGTWQDYFALQQIRRENESLKDEVGKLRIEMQRESDAAARLMQAIEEVTATPSLHTRDLGGNARTVDVTNAVCEKLAGR
jgi:hypothetical protein